MLPIGPLMWEHRRIERMVEHLKKELERIRAEETANPVFIDAVVDFFRMYADRCHHGKEEDILFERLEDKDLSDDHKKILNELIEEHKAGREMVGDLARAKESYIKGDEGALGEIVTTLDRLVHFYPVHIAKEDKHFFHPCMEYFSKNENDVMLEKFREFDGELIHEKYEAVVEKVENLSS